ncbi:hypothetical protein [Paenibacillus sp. 1A_MP2]|uniref:hypothetical protein n=1 Tax=Paenibacillus sp. 1A_MP2 TaxID=3457495 RepID=UPI003FCC50D6
MRLGKANQTEAAHTAGSEPMTEYKLILVKRRTRLEELVVRYNTVQQAQFYIERLGRTSVITWRKIDVIIIPCIRPSSSSANWVGFRPLIGNMCPTLFLEHRTLWSSSDRTVWLPIRSSM